MTSKPRPDTIANTCPRVGFAALTEREWEILPYVAAGWLYREIAEQLTVDERTIRTHAESIRRKLQARNRTEVAGICYEANKVTIGQLRELRRVQVDYEIRPQLAPAIQVQLLINGHVIADETMRLSEE